jgi:hypothetical protein
MKRAALLCAFLAGCGGEPMEPVIVQWKKEDCEKRGLKPVGFYDASGYLTRIQCQLPK